jgi:four helix bundle protein
MCIQVIIAQTSRMNPLLFDKNAIMRHSFEFSLQVIRYCDNLCEQKRFVLSNQLLRAGTSIGANVMEAQNSESLRDFIHKMKLAAKEADETQYWLLLCAHSPQCPDCKSLLSKLQEIQKLLTTILSSSQRKLS